MRPTVILRALLLATVLATLAWLLYSSTGIVAYADRIGFLAMDGLTQIALVERGAPRDSDCRGLEVAKGTSEVLHVVYATNPGHVEGIQASIASVLNSTTKPRALVIHLLVQPKWAPQFKEIFGVRPWCNSTRTLAGARIEVHDVVGQLKESVATLSTEWERKEQSALENFARFRMHLVLGTSGIAVYLDSDTIVQADLRGLRKKLKASGKTVAFVKRDEAYQVFMGKFLKQSSKECGFRASGWGTELMRKPAYNVGVWVVNFQRWLAQGALQRVEDFIAQQNACGGTLWLGGSQAPLLLAFLDQAVDAPKDYIVVDASWNFCNLGGTPRWLPEELTRKRVLHWSGRRKPWLADGLYRELWLPHRERLSQLLHFEDKARDVEHKK